ncbi:uncharacterized protein DFL_000395 [Arthrobotrys flagrans]|uniref:CENP-V/GFA domain-containing protein n=1 Tax=Arthrobotrys flagrans TaxID=97331 RepID=A0A437ADU1_ARTFL|nr:hypothetical protein DFL_000395 [Arthrobotrys flagrans]
MSEQQSNETLSLVCHCTANSYSFPITLPLDHNFTDIKLCQCTDCRLQTGNLASWFIRAPNKPFDPESLPETLTAYRISTSLTHYFCSICSSQLFRLEERQDGGYEAEFWVFTGCLKVPRDYQFKIRLVNGIDKGSDGGLASWLPGVEYYDTDGASFTDEVLWSSESPEDNLNGDEDSTGTLIGKCHCSNIELRLSRLTGSQEDKPPFVYSDNTDLVIPYWTPLDQQPPIDPVNPWWIRDGVPRSGLKRFLGGNCTCTSCRTISGTEVQSWIFVPTPSIHLVLPEGDTTPWPSRDTLVGGLDERLNSIMGIYQSTPGDPGVVRGFCKTCGANIFWDGLTRRNFIDLSAGLFTINGTKQKDWIEWWTHRVSYVEDTRGTSREDIGILLEKGLREWGERVSFV